MTTEADFWAAVVRDPCRRELYAAYADWLYEQGREDAAAWVRGWAWLAMTGWARAGGRSSRVRLPSRNARGPRYCVDLVTSPGGPWRTFRVLVRGGRECLAYRRVGPGEWDWNWDYTWAEKPWQAAPLEGLALAALGRLSAGVGMEGRT